MSPEQIERFRTLPVREQLGMLGNGGEKLNLGGSLPATKGPGDLGVIAGYGLSNEVAAGRPLTFGVNVEAQRRLNPNFGALPEGMQGLSEWAFAEHAEGGAMLRSFAARGEELYGQQGYIVTSETPCPQLCGNVKDVPGIMFTTLNLRQPSTIVASYNRRCRNPPRRVVHPVRGPEPEPGCLQHEDRDRREDAAVQVPEERDHRARLAAGPGGRPQDDRGPGRRQEAGRDGGRRRSRRPRRGRRGRLRHRPPGGRGRLGCRPPGPAAVGRDRRVRPDTPRRRARRSRDRRGRRGRPAHRGHHPPQPGRRGRRLVRRSHAAGQLRVQHAARAGRLPGDGRFARGGQVRPADRTAARGRPPARLQLAKCPASRPTSAPSPARRCSSGPTSPPC